MTDLISLDFSFSQSNLQTFTYCRRRFYLRYIKKLIWPAQLVGDDHYTQDRDAGVRFHRLVHQHFLGFDPALLKKVAEADSDHRVADWFKTFLSNPISRLEGKLMPEALYTADIAGHSLSAKVDLLQIDAGTVTIYDWKTSRKLPTLTILQKQAQSKVYPLVVSKVFQKDLAAFKPPLLSMVYWEANFPEQTIVINSSQADWEKYEIEITALIDLILSLETEEFVKTPDIRKCGWCEYRSYCQRGNVAQDWEEHPESDLIDDEIKIPGDAVDAWGSV